MALCGWPNERRARVLVIGAPYRDQTTNPTEASLMIRYRSALRSAMQEQRVPFLEIRELTEVAYPANQGWFGELIHPNHMGHRLMAAEILKMFEPNQLLNEVSIPKLTP